MEETKTPARFSTFGKGILLIVGGAGLGFFGCLGSIAGGVEQVMSAMLFLGGALMLCGFGLVIAAIWRGFTKR